MGCPWLGRGRFWILPLGSGAAPTGRYAPRAASRAAGVEPAVREGNGARKGGIGPRSDDLGRQARRPGAVWVRVIPRGVEASRVGGFGEKGALVGRRPARSVRAWIARGSQATRCRRIAPVTEGKMWVGRRRPLARRGPRQWAEDGVFDIRPGEL